MHFNPCLAGQSPKVLRENLPLLARLFSLVSIIYLTSFSTLVVPDTMPTSLDLFNWKQFGTIYYDNLCGTSNIILAQSFPVVRLANGQLGTFYPLGTSILVAPLYLLYVASLNLLNINVDITSLAFEPLRAGFEKISASILAASASVLFAMVLLQRFDRRTTLISTLVYALGTGMWSVCSSNLWQHTSINFLLNAAIFLILHYKAANNRNAALLPILIGLILGFIPFVRPTALVFTFALMIVLRVWTLPFISSVAIGMLPGLTSNILFFNHPFGGYQAMFGDTLFRLSLADFRRGAWGLIFDPFRGLVVFSPILLFAPVGFYIFWKKEKDGSLHRLLMCLVLSGLMLFTYYSCNIFWTGGFVYGPRYLLDILPIACFFVAYVVEHFRLNPLTVRMKIMRALFVILLVISIGIQAIGAHNLPWPRWKGNYFFVDAVRNYWPAGFPAPSWQSIFLGSCK